MAASTQSPPVASAPTAPDAAAPDAAARISESAELMLAQVEEETARIARLKRQAEAAELARHRLEAALESLAPALPKPQADALRRRLLAARRGERAPMAARAEAPLAAIMELLANWERRVIAVADAQDHVLDRGFAMKRTYAAQVLQRLAAQGLVAKTGRGRYRIIRTHPDLVALRLAALERELAKF
ncbi:hypothetical protein [Rubrimonas cliftonensis]|uniref:Uncharacterized protein n=1 Tax=Rubrimonas cliftonensis TaxID=89524 RepID=A0A1H4A579_9RHOB|nr:hypothetical protein [Rubrimonas cliftonensis]SEA30958.1 hypothetical protein SAMN05444370_10468 [Rubrimonas cliftonensis]